MTENRHPTSNAKPTVSHAILMQPSFSLKEIEVKSWSAIVQRLLLLVFLNSLSLAPALGFDIFSAACSAVGGAFSGPAATGLSYVTNTVVGKGHEFLTTPKAPKNTINIRVNSLSEEGVKKICISNICRLNSENKKISDDTQDNLKHFKAVLQKNNTEIDSWLEKYLISIHCIQQVTTFLTVYHDVHDFLISQQKILNSGTAIPKRKREEMNQKYETFINHIQDRRKKIGAMVKNQFPYNGEGGVSDRYKSSSMRRSERFKLYGVDTFGPTDHERTSSPLDEIKENPKEKLDKKLNYFATAYQETVNQLHRNHMDILDEYDTDRVTLYELLGLSSEGLLKLPAYTSTSTSSSSRSKAIPIPSSRRLPLDSWGTPPKSRTASSAPVKSRHFNSDESDDESSGDESDKMSGKRAKPATKTKLPKALTKKSTAPSKLTASLLKSQDSSDDESDDGSEGESSGDEAPVPAKSTAKAKAQKAPAKPNTTKSKSTASVVVPQDSSDDESDASDSAEESEEENTPKKASASNESDDDSDDSDASDGLLK